ncbi:MAG TPA: hypothetical protein VN436_12465 [Holophaga sp.]|nr:hypothetical protein [Holophaga sp.]
MRMKLVEEGTGKDWGTIDLPVVPRVGEEILLTEATEMGAAIVAQVVYDMGEPVHPKAIRTLDSIHLVCRA